MTNYKDEYDPSNEEYMEDGNHHMVGCLIVLAAVITILCIAC